MKSNKILSSGIIFLIMFLSLICNVSAQNYIIADIKIADNGIVSFDGESSINPGIEGVDFSDGKISGETQMLTEKKEGKWNFILNLEENYSEIYLNNFDSDKIQE